MGTVLLNQRRDDMLKKMLQTFQNTKTSADNVDDEMFYEIVAKEISEGVVRQGLWAKSLSDSGCNEQNAKARYIKLRVESLKKETEIYAAEMRLQAEERQKQLNLLYSQWKQTKVLTCPSCRHFVGPKVLETAQELILTCPSCKQEILRASK